MLQEMLNELKLPEYPGREEALRILSDQVYGVEPPQPEKVWATVNKVTDPAYANKAIRTDYEVHFTYDGREASFPFTLTVPKGVTKPITVIEINFHPISNVYYPAEELVDEGVAVAHLNYEEVADDSMAGFDGAVAKALNPGERSADSWGMISLWAWAASRIADILCTMPELDTANLGVIGHSRLGKTALVCGARDTRFRFVCSNDSGCSGASLSRDTHGETVERIYHVFPYWFCPNYEQWSGREYEMPFDQHFLVSAIEDRFVLINSAEEDEWAWPKNEFLCAVKSGMTDVPDRLPQAPESFLGGRIAYSIRTGSHYLSRYDWCKFVEFIRLHRKG